MLLPWKCRRNTNLFLACVKLIENSAVNVVASNPCVAAPLRIEIFLYLLSICTDELISAPKIITFFSMLPSANENSERELSPIL